MSAWSGAGWRGDFYGHIFRLNNEGIKNLGRTYNFRISSKRHKRVGTRFGKRINRKKKKMSQRLKKSSLQKFHNLRYDDILNQKHWFVKLQRTGKRSSNGIYNSMRYIRNSDYEYSVGQNKYYTHYLLHGNVSGGTFATFTRGSLFGGTFTESGIYIFPKNAKVLKIDPMGKNEHQLAHHVRTYESKGNYIMSSYNELKPWLRQKYKKQLWFTMSGAAQEG